MNTVKKRILSAVLAVSSLGLIMPAEIGSISGNVSVIAAAYNEGTYEQLTYCTYDSNQDGVYDYIEISDCDESAVSVEIPAAIDGIPVTNIGDGAFFGCKSMKSILIPDGVTDIEGYAFSECESLTSLVIPDSVLNIGNAAFNECINLSNIIIGDGVSSIGYEAFRNCAGLESITIGAGITELNRIPYNQSSVSEINVSEENDVYSSIDGVLLSKDKTELVRFPADKKSENYIIPDSVKEINENAFDGCVGVTGLTFGNGMTYINDDIFADCPLTNLVIGNSIETISENEFSGFENLSSIKLGDSIKKIGSGAFSGTSWYNAQPDGVIYLDNWCLGCKNELADKNVIINDGTIGIADYSFDYSDIESVVFPNSLKYTGDLVFSNSSLNEVTMNDGLDEIGNYAFYACSGLTSADIPDSVKTIGESAFADCTNLLSVKLPKTIVSIGSNSFFGCDKLKSVVIPETAEKIAEKSIGYSSNGETISGFRIYGTSGTAAETYAHENNIIFIDVNKTVMLSTTELAMTAGEIVLLQVKNYDGEIKWISDDKMIATVDKDGYVEGISEGEATIYAIAGDEMLSCKVSVAKAAYTTPSVTTSSKKTITTISVKTTPITTTTKKVTTLPITTPIITTTKKVTTLPTTTAITPVTSVTTSVSTSDNISVIKPDKELTINTGDEVTLEITNYTGNVTWVSEDLSIATADKGKIRAVSEGTVTVYAITENRTFRILIHVVGKNVLGDANNDGKLTANDAAFIARKLAEGKSNELPEMADFNNDGKITALDAAAIAKRLASRTITIKINIHFK